VAQATMVTVDPSVQHTGKHCCQSNYQHYLSTMEASQKVFRIGTVRYNWPMPAHASQAFSIAIVPIRKTFFLSTMEAYPPSANNRQHNATQLTWCSNHVTRVNPRSQRPQVLQRNRNVNQTEPKPNKPLLRKSM